MLQKTIFIVLLFISMLCFSQDKIILTPTGIKSTETGKDYIVITFDNVNQKDLFINSIHYISTKYSNPDKQIKLRIEDSILQFTEDIPITKITSDKHLLNGFKRNVQVDIKISFKPAAIKLEVINFNLGNIILVGTKFNKFPIWDNETLLLKIEKENIETELNALVVNYVRFLQDKNKEVW